MPEVKDLIKDFYAKYDKDAYSEEKAKEIEDYYNGDVSSLAKDFYAKYDKDSYSEQKVSELVDYYSSKKKDQEEPQEEVQEVAQEEPQEMVQEDTESVSEDGSLESQDWRGEQEKSVAPVVTSNEETFKALEQEGELEDVKEKEEFLETSGQKVESVFRPKEEKGGQEAVSRFLTENNFSSLDALPNEFSEIIKNQNPTVFNTDIERNLYSTRNEEITNLSKSYLENKKNSIQSEEVLAGKTEDEAKRIADLDIEQETKDIGIYSIGLDEEEIGKYKDAIEQKSNNLLRISEIQNDPNKKGELKYLQELNLSFDKLISELRENGDKAFIDENGDVNKDLKEDVEKREVGFKQEYKSDYAKLYDRLSLEIAKKDALRENLVKTLTPEQYQNFGGDKFIINQGTDNEQEGGAYATVDNILGDKGADYSEYFMGDTFDPKLKAKSESYVEAYDEADRNIKALSRLLFLNEDPAAVERGWGTVFSAEDSEFYLPGLDKLGEVVTSFGETFFEEMTGVDYTSDSDFRQNAVKVLQEEGMKLTEEQVEAGEKNFSEKLGDTLGVSGKIGLEILATRNVIGGGFKLLNTPRYLSKIAYLRKSPKLVKFLDNTAEIVTEGLAFELADDRTDFFMGTAESGSAKGFDSLIGKLSKSKYGKFLKYLDNYAGRFTKQVTSRTVGGVTEEYVGDFVSEGVKNGFFTEEQYKNVFGEGEEGVEKFLLTLGSVGFMTFPTGFVEAAKKKAEGDPTGSLAQSIEAYEAAQNPEVTTEKVKKSIEDLTNTLKGEDVDLEGLTEEKKLEIIGLDVFDKNQRAVDAKEKDAEIEKIVGEEVESEPQRLDDMSEEELEAYAKENDVDISELKEETTEVEPGDITAKSEEVVEERTTTDTTTEEVVEEGDTFTQEELDVEITEDKLQSYVDRIKSIRESRKGKVLSDPLGINAIIDGMLVAVEKSLQAGITLRNAFQKAKKEALEIKNLTKEQKKKIKTLNETALFKDFVDVVSKVKDKNKSNIGDKVKPTINKSTGVTKPSTQVQTTEKQILIDKLKNQSKGADVAVKGIKKNQEEFIKYVNESSKYLTELQKKTVRSLISKVKNPKTLTEATKKLSNIVEYGVLNPKTSDIVSSKGRDTKVTLSEKQVLIDKLKNQDKGATVAIKGVKQNQKKFNQYIKESIPFLTNAQQSIVRNLSTSVKDSKTLSDATSKLANMVQYGSLSPSVKNKVEVTTGVKKGKDENIITTKKEELKKRLIEQTKGAKNLRKSQQKMIDDLFKSIETNSKSLTKAQLKAALKRAAKADPAKINDFLELRDSIIKQLKKGELKEKKAEAKRIQSRLKRKAKKTTGFRKSLALDLSRLNINRVDDIDAFLDAANGLIESLDGKATMKDVKAQAQDIIAKALDAETKFRTEKEKLINDALKEEYDTANLSMSFEEYKNLKEEQSKQDAKDKKLEAAAEAREDMVNWLNSRIDKLKTNLNDLTDGMTERQKAIVKDLINSKNLLNKKDGKGEYLLLDSESLMDLHSAIDEVFTFNSTAGVNKISTALKSIKKAEIFRIKLNNMIDAGIFTKDFKIFGLLNLPVTKIGNLSAYAKASTISERSAKDFASILFAEYNKSWEKSKLQTQAFLKRRAEKRDELKIKEKQSNKIGVISWLTQEDEGLTVEESNKNLKDKIESLKNQIKKLKEVGKTEGKKSLSERFGRKTAETRKAELLEKIVKDLNLESIETKVDPATGESNLENLLTPNEKEFLNFLKDEFEQLKEPLAESYLNAKGEEITFVKNYLPTFAKNLGAKDNVNLDNDFSSTGMSADPSGRTIKRTEVVTTGNVSYNFDVLGTTEAGYGQISNDINSLVDKQVLINVVKSKPVKKLYIREGQNLKDQYESLQERVKTLINKRNPNFARDIGLTNEYYRFAENAIRNTVALPLRNTFQLAKQLAPIILNTAIKNPVYFAQGFSLATLSMGKNRQFVDTLLAKASNTSLRVLEGDESLAKTKSLAEYIQGKLMRGETLSKIDKKFLSKIGGGALAFSDKLASQGSWLSFYMAERAKQEKGNKDWTFDIEEESKNPNTAAAEKANVESDWVNNKSDVTTAPKEWIEDKNTYTTVKSLFFLFKSFAINQSYNAALDARNILYGVGGKGKMTTKQRQQAVKASASGLVGALASMWMFEMIKSSLVNPVLDEIVESLFDIDDPDEDKEVFDKDALEENSVDALLKSSLDLAIGGVPDVIATIGIKQYLNSLLIENAKEKYDKMKADNEDLGLGEEIEPFNEWENKVFYDKYNTPGSLGLFDTYKDQTFKNAQIISGEEYIPSYDDVLDEESLVGLGDDGKKLAMLNFIALVMQHGDLKLLTDRAIKNKEKQIKRESDLRKKENK